MRCHRKPTCTRGSLPPNGNRHQVRLAWRFPSSTLTGMLVVSFALCPLAGAVDLLRKEFTAHLAKHGGSVKKLLQMAKFLEDEVRTSVSDSYRPG